MARYVDDKRVIWTPPKGQQYTKTLKPGDENNTHGIYVCTGCGREIALPVGHKAPPQNKHQHPQGVGDVEWRLLVIADGRSDAERASGA